jgi:hypothetical protein
MEVFGNPRKEQVDQFFGVDGYAVKDGGGSGYRVTAQGLIVGSAPGPAALAAAVASLENLRDGQDHVLVDTLGRVYTNARLTEFRPAGPIQTDAWTGKCIQPYSAVWETWL